MFQFMKNFIGWLAGRKYAVKDSSGVYRKVLTVTVPSEPNKMVEICDWDPKHTINAIDGYITNKFSTESGDYEIKRAVGLSGFHVWRENDKLYIIKTSDYGFGGEATIIVYYTKS